MELKFERVRNVKAPTRAHPEDAGIDFYVPDDFKDLLLAGRRVSIPSGIKVDVPKGYVLVSHNKSGVSHKKGLVVTASVVDSGYQGEVHICLANINPESSKDDLDYTGHVMINPGDKIVQFILLPVCMAEPTEVIRDTLFMKGKSSRATGGFGSTGE